MGQKSSAGKCKIGIGLFIAFFLFQCSEEKKNELPKGVLPPEKMEEMLFSLHYQEAKLLMSGIRQDTAYLLFDTLQKQIMNRLNVDSTSLRLSLNYYSQNVELLDSLYKRMETTAQSKIDSNTIR
ncbi:MAG TPA: DUF4296 domain-containing protein [Catalimonadaceae bacterium]|nr:DUF4296 domain-containing protein [Catalimonadaceae bacterium]